MKQSIQKNHTPASIVKASPITIHGTRDTCPPLEAAEVIADKILALLDAVAAELQAPGQAEGVKS